MSAERQVLPDQVWTAFWALLLAGSVLGALCGAGIVSGLVLGLSMAAALAVFVPWAVFLISPRELSEEPEYEGEGGETP